MYVSGLVNKERKALFGREHISQANGGKMYSVLVGAREKCLLCVDGDYANIASLDA
jgi:hypothetical protein